MNHKVYVISVLMVLMFSTSICVYISRALPQNGIITFPATRKIPDIDGILGSDEWADANVIDISSGNLTGYLSIKCDSQFLYLLIEFINDTTPPVTYPRENTWVAIDTLDDGGTAPQTDDYLFNSEYSWANLIWQGTGSDWTVKLPPPDYYAVQVFSNSSYSNSTHLVNEIRIPLSLLGNSTHYGFYVGVCDSNMHRNIEWPTGAGGTWNWWPPSTGSFPAPNLWGTIEFPTEPIAIIDYSPEDPIVNESITFSGGSSYDVFGNIVNYSWNFGAGTNASGITAFHAYSSPGTYPVMLNVTDNDGFSDYVVENVTVYSFRPNIPPVANFTGSPSIPRMGENVIFNGSSSHDPDGWIVSYNWNLGDGTKMNGSVVSHAFSADGSYDVSLTVTDNKGVSSTSIEHFTVLTDWSSDTRLTEDSGHDHSPSIMQAEDGAIWIVWYSDRTVDNELYYKISFNGGATWTNDTRLTNSPSSEDMKPSVMQTSDGTIWVVWSSNRLGAYNVYYKTSDDDGLSWSNDTRLTAEIDEDPSVMQTSDDTIWVVWSSNRGGNIDLYYKISSDGGATWTNDTRLTDHLGSDVAPSVMQVSDGTIWVVWSSNRDGPLNVYYKTSDDNGLSWSNDTPLIQDADRDNTPSFLQTFDGTIWVVWSSNRWDLEEDMLFYTTSSDGGATWTNDTRITFVTGPNRIDREPSVMQASDGTIWVTWASDRIPSGIGPWGQFEIYYKTKLLRARIHIVSVGEEEFEIATVSNSSITAFQLNTTTKTLSFNVTGIEGTVGFCNVSIPADLLWGDFSIYKNGSRLSIDKDYNEAYNGTHHTFCIAYTHTTHTIEIQGTEVIPEFPSATILLLFMLFALIAVALAKKIQCKAIAKAT